MRMRPVLFIYLFFLVAKANAQILPLREQARVIDEMLSERIDSLLPVLMEKNGIDMWIVISREYNEDPLLKTMLPATWLNARRRTMLIFYNNTSKKQFEKLAIARDVYKRQVYALPFFLREIFYHRSKINLRVHIPVV